MTINLKSFKAEIAKYNSPLKAIEVNFSKGYDKQRGEWSKIYLTVKGILKEASMDDSRYRVVKLFSSNEFEKEDLEKAFNQIQEIANELQVECYLPDTNKEYNPGWIVTQSPPPIIDWNVEWESIEWDEDGTRIVNNGIKLIKADRGSYANAELVQFFNKKLAGPYTMKIHILDLQHQENYSPFGFCSDGSFTLSDVSIHEIREIAQRNFDFLEVVKYLLSNPSNYTVKEIMIAFNFSFQIEFEETEIIADWAKKKISDQELKSKLEQSIGAKESDWFERFKMREAFNNGQKPSEFLCFQNTSSIMNLLNEFGLDLSNGKRMHQLLLDKTNLNVLDTLFFEQIENKTKPNNMYNA